MVVWVASTFGGNGLRRVVWRLTLFFFFLMLSSTLLLPLQCFKLILTAVSLEFWCKNCRYVMSLLFCLILRRLTVIDSLHVHYSTIRNLAIEVSVKIWFWFGVNMQYILLNILLSSYWLGKGSGLFFWILKLSLFGNISYALRVWKSCNEFKTTTFVML